MEKILKQINQPKLRMAGDILNKAMHKILKIKDIDHDVVAWLLIAATSSLLKDVYYAQIKENPVVYPDVPWVVYSEVTKALVDLGHINDAALWGELIAVKKEACGDGVLGEVESPSRTSED